MSGDAPLITFRNPNVVFIEKTISVSGKYLCFLGVHYEKGHSCWVVGCSNKASGEILMRHYNDMIEHCVAPQAQAYTYWEEFKTRMTTRRDNVEEEPSYLEELQKYIN